VPCARRIPPVQEALRQPRQQLQPLVGLAQKQPACIRADRAAVKPRRHLARKMGLESEAALGTFCLGKAAILLARTAAWKLSYAGVGGFLLELVRNVG
jgi:hypothetical protein